MSWSFSAVGKASAVVKAIEESSNNQLTGQSLEEWNEAKPALIALVGANVGKVLVSVNANGHASFEVNNETQKRVKTHGQCGCVVSTISGFVE